jgi:hypothetical protein
VTLGVIFVAAILVAAYAYVLVNAPAQVTVLDTAVAAIAAVAATVAGRLYVQVEGEIDKNALPADPNAPTFESVMELIKELAALAAVVVKADRQAAASATLGAEPAAAPPAPAPVPPQDPPPTQ